MGRTRYCKIDIQSKTQNQTKKEGKISWFDKHINLLTAINMALTLVLAIIVGCVTVSINSTQRDIAYQEAKPSFSVNAEYIESKRNDTKDADFGEPLVGINEITKVTISNDGAMLYKPSFTVIPFFQVRRMVNDGYPTLEYDPVMYKSRDEYDEMITHPRYHLETIYRPVLLNVAEQNMNLYRTTITGTKKGELCVISDSNIIKKIISLFDSIKPIYTIANDFQGHFWVLQNGKYVEKDRAMMYISLEYFLEIRYSTTMDKMKEETEVYHVVTGHDAYVGTSDFGEPVKVSLLTPDDYLFEYYTEMKNLRDKGVIIATDYPINNEAGQFIDYYEMDVDDIFYSTMLEMSNRTQ